MTEALALAGHLLVWGPAVWLLWRWNRPEYMTPPRTPDVLGGRITFDSNDHIGLI